MQHRDAILHLVTGEHSLRHSLADAFLDGRDELIRNRTARHAVKEREVQFRVVVVFSQMFEASLREVLLGIDVARQRKYLHVNFSKLTGTTRLLLVPVRTYAVAGACFAVGNLRRVMLNIDLVTSLHSIHQDLKMQLAHAMHDHFVGLLFARN